jgi:hypothetical protein
MCALSSFLVKSFRKNLSFVMAGVAYFFLTACTQSSLDVNGGQNFLSVNNSDTSQTSLQVYQQGTDLTQAETYVTGFNIVNGTITIPACLVNSTACITGSTTVFSARNSDSVLQPTNLFIRSYLPSARFLNGDYYFETVLISQTVEINSITTALAQVLKYGFNFRPQLTRQEWVNMMTSVEVVCADCLKQSTTGVLNAILSNNLLASFSGYLSNDNPGLAPATFAPGLKDLSATPNLASINAFSGQTAGSSLVNWTSQVIQGSADGTTPAQVTAALYDPMNSSERLSPDSWTLYSTTMTPTICTSTLSSPPSWCKTNYNEIAAQTLILGSAIGPNALQTSSANSFSQTFGSGQSGFYVLVATKNLSAGKWTLAVPMNISFAYQAPAIASSLSFSTATTGQTAAQPLVFYNYHTTCYDLDNFVSDSDGLTLTFGTGAVTLDGSLPISAGDFTFTTGTGVPGGTIGNILCYSPTTTDAAKLISNVTSTIGIPITVNLPTGSQAKPVSTVLTLGLQILTVNFPTISQVSLTNSLSVPITSLNEGTSYNIGVNVILTGNQPVVTTADSQGLSFSGCKVANTTNSTANCVANGPCDTHSIITIPNTPVSVVPVGAVTTSTYAGTIVAGYLEAVGSSVSASANVSCSLNFSTTMIPVPTPSGTLPSVLANIAWPLASSNLSTQENISIVNIDDPLFWTVNGSRYNPYTGPVTALNRSASPVYLNASLASTTFTFNGAAVDANGNTLPQIAAAPCPGCDAATSATNLVSYNLVGAPTDNLFNVGTCSTPALGKDGSGNLTMTFSSLPHDISSDCSYTITASNGGGTDTIKAGDIYPTNVVLIRVKVSQFAHTNATISNPSSCLPMFEDALNTISVSSLISDPDAALNPTTNSVALVVAASSNASTTNYCATNFPSSTLVIPNSSPVNSGLYNGLDPYGTMLSGSFSQPNPLVPASPILNLNFQISHQYDFGGGHCTGAPTTPSNCTNGNAYTYTVKQTDTSLTDLAYNNAVQTDFTVIVFDEPSPLTMTVKNSGLGNVTNTTSNPFVVTEGQSLSFYASLAAKVPTYFSGDTSYNNYNYTVTPSCSGGSGCTVLHETSTTVTGLSATTSPQNIEFTLAPDPSALYNKTASPNGVPFQISLAAACTNCTAYYYSPTGVPTSVLAATSIIYVNIKPIAPTTLVYSAPTTSSYSMANSSTSNTITMDLASDFAPVSVGSTTYQSQSMLLGLGGTADCDYTASSTEQSNDKSMVLAGTYSGVALGTWKNNFQANKFCFSSWTVQTNSTCVIYKSGTTITASSPVSMTGTDGWGNTVTSSATLKLKNAAFVSGTTCNPLK